MTSSFQNQTKYQAVYNVLNKQIRSGQLLPGDLVPSLEELCREYEVSKITARHAISCLVSDGLLYRIQGKGTFVAERKSTPATVGLLLVRLIHEHDTTLGALHERQMVLPTIGGIEKHLRRYNTSLQLAASDDDYALERQFIQNVLDRQVDGAIIFYCGGESNRDKLEELRASGIPLVLIDRYPPGWTGSYVVTNNFSGAHQAMEYLLERGFSRTFYLASEEDVSSVTERIAGFQAELRGHNLPVTNCVQLVATRVGYQQIMQEAYQITRTLLQEEALPLGFFAGTTQIFSGIWQAVQDSGVDLNQIGLASFDTPPIAIPPEVTYVRVVQPLDEICCKSVEVLMEHLAGDTTPQQVQVPPIIQQFDTTDYLSTFTVAVSSPAFPLGEDQYRKG